MSDTSDSLEMPLTHSKRCYTHRTMTWIQSVALYVYNIWISIDQTANVLTGGDPDETISSRLGRIKRRNNGHIPWSRPIARITDNLLELIQPGHSDHSIEPGHGGHGVIDLPIANRQKWWQPPHSKAAPNAHATTTRPHGTPTLSPARRASWIRRLLKRCQITR